MMVMAMTNMNVQVALVQLCRLLWSGGIEAADAGTADAHYDSTASDNIVTASA